jgi:hypothetical protein
MRHVRQNHSQIVLVVPNPAAGLKLVAGHKED